MTVKSLKHHISITNHLLFLSIVAGIIFCYYFVTLYFTADSDVSNSAIVWHEVNSHGISALKQWRPTPDNWYFSTYYIHFLLFKLFDSTSPEILKLLSIMQVIIAAVLASLICYEKTKNKLAFVLILFFCALSGYAYSYGYIAHPFSHNLTNLYGLACIYIYILNTKRHDIKLDLLICILVLMASLSDPWFLAAFYLPLLLAQVYDVYVTRLRKKFTLVPLMITGIILFSHVIEKSLGLTIASFSFGTFDQITNNIYWYFVSIGAMLNLFFVEENSYFVLSSIILIFLFIRLNLKINKIDSSDLIIILSVTGISAAFILGNVPSAKTSARFLVNIIYLGIVSILINGLITLKKEVLCVIGILCFSGIYSNFAYNNHNDNKDSLELINFLQKNDLNYGFGPYWGTNALAVSWNSNWKTIIRPVTFDKTNGFMKFPGRMQTFDYWYIPENNTSNKQFIAIVNDGEECAQLSTCLDGVRNQYGQPNEILNFKDIIFYVYHQQLIHYSWPELSAAGVIKMNNVNENFNWPGWSSQESEYRWTEGKTASLLLSYSGKWSVASFALSSSSYQNLSGYLTYNGNRVEDFEIPVGSNVFKFSVNNDHSGNQLSIKIHFNELERPKDKGINNDLRELGLAVKKIEYNFE